MNPQTHYSRHVSTPLERIYYGCNTYVEILYYIDVQIYIMVLNKIYVQNIMVWTIILWVAVLRWIN